MRKLICTKFRFKKIQAFWLLPFFFSHCTNSEQGKEYGSWGVYGGSKTRMQYSSLKEVDTTNVQQLKPAWEYHTKDMTPGSQIQANAIIIGITLYGVSPN